MLPLQERGVNIDPATTTSMGGRVGLAVPQPPGRPVGDVVSGKTGAPWLDEVARGLLVRGYG